MDKLYFLTAGVPLRAGTKGYGRGFEIHDEMGLDGLELEFVHGVRISDKSREQVADAVKKYNLSIKFLVTQSLSHLITLFELFTNLWINNSNKVFTITHKETTKLQHSRHN